MPPRAMLRKADTSTSATSSTLTSSASSDEPPQQSSSAVLLTSAPPPLHAVVCVLVLLTVFLRTLPSLSQLDENGAVESFSVRLFPELLSVSQLAYIRGIFAAAIWTTTVLVVTGPGWISATRR